MNYRFMPHDSPENALSAFRFSALLILRASAKNNCTILLDLWPICGVAWKATYLDMQPFMRLADEPNPGATRHDYFLPRP
jgi:hypothetical protein